MDDLEARVAFVSQNTTWDTESVRRLLSRFSRLTNDQAIAAIRAATAHARDSRDDFAWVYAFQLAAFVSEPS